MYEIIENSLVNGKYKVKVVVSPDESMVLWFDTSPTQEQVDSVIATQLQQQVVQQATVEVFDSQSCSPWQFRKALNQLGLRDAVEYAVANSHDQTVKDGWEYATSFSRYDPFVVQFGEALWKTDAELDALIMLAKSL